MAAAVVTCHAVDVPTVPDPVPEPLDVKYAYAPTAAIATTTTAPTRATLFRVLMNFIFPYLPFKEPITTTGA